MADTRVEKLRQSWFQGASNVPEHAAADTARDRISEIEAAGLVVIDPLELARQIRDALITEGTIYDPDLFQNIAPEDDLLLAVVLNGRWREIDMRRVAEHVTRGDDRG